MPVWCLGFESLRCDRMGLSWLLSVLLPRPILGERRINEEKVNTTTTATGSKTVQTSATNIALAVNDERDFKNIITGYRDGYFKSLGRFGQEASELGKRKRDALHRDLDAALAIIMVIKQPEYAEWLLEALEETGIPVVEDETKNNIFVMYCRLLMGRWETPNGDKAGGAMVFRWGENVWLYASVLRAASAAGLKGGGDLCERLAADNGLSKLKAADRKTLATDQREKDKLDRFKAVTSRAFVKATIPAAPFANVSSSGLVLLFGTVSADKQGIQVHGVLDESPAAVAARVAKFAEAHGKEAIHERQLAAMDAKMAKAQAKAERVVEYAKERLSELGQNTVWNIETYDDDDDDDEDEAI